MPGSRRADATPEVLQLGCPPEVLRRELGVAVLGHRVGVVAQPQVRVAVHRLEVRCDGRREFRVAEVCVRAFVEPCAKHLRELRGDVREDVVRFQPADDLFDLRSTRL